MGIIIAFGIVIIWKFLGLDELTVPIIGILALGYLILSRRQKKADDTTSKQIDKLTAGILTSLILLIIMVTGGLTSPLFFLLYFIPFALSFMLIPESVFIFLLGVIILFLPMAMDSQITENLIKLGSVLLITPLAYFFGKEYRLVNEHTKKDMELASRISNEAANVLKDQTANLADTDKAQLADIIQESEQLKNE
ncbi:hypothetical protein BH09PAT1_BH09PAT1_5700 [soil metagenome]